MGPPPDDELWKPAPPRGTAPRPTMELPAQQPPGSPAPAAESTPPEGRLVERAKALPPRRNTAAFEFSPPVLQPVAPPPVPEPFEPPRRFSESSDDDEVTQELPFLPELPTSKHPVPLELLEETRVARGAGEAEEVEPLAELSDEEAALHAKVDELKGQVQELQKALEAERSLRQAAEQEKEWTQGTLEQVQRRVRELEAALQAARVESEGMASQVAALGATLESALDSGTARERAARARAEAAEAKLKAAEVERAELRQRLEQALGREQAG